VNDWIVGAVFEAPACWNDGNTPTPFDTRAVPDTPGVINPVVFGAVCTSMFPELPPVLFVVDPTFIVESDVLFVPPFDTPSIPVDGVVARFILSDTGADVPFEIIGWEVGVTLLSGHKG